MDLSTIYKFNKLIKSYNDEISDTKKKSISKNITNQVLKLKKNNKDRTKILNSYRKWLKNNNEMKNIQTGGGDEIYQNIVIKLEELEKNAQTFTQTITSLQNIFNNPSTNTDYKDLLTNLKNPDYNNKVSDIMQLFELFNEKNLLGNIIQNYYAIFNNNSLKNLLTTQKKYNNTKQTGFYVKDNNFNDVIFSKIATGTFYEQKPNKASKDFYIDWNINATPPVLPKPSTTGTGAATGAATGTGAATIGSATTEAATTEAATTGPATTGAAAAIDTVAAQAPAPAPAPTSPAAAPVQAPAQAPAQGAASIDTIAAAINKIKQQGQLRRTATAAAAAAAAIKKKKQQAQKTIKISKY
jgi:hypothetical protein